METVDRSLVKDIADQTSLCGQLCDLRQNAEAWCGDVLAFLFPHFCSRAYDRNLSAIAENLAERFVKVTAESGKPSDGATGLLDFLPGLRSHLLKDAEAIHANDPAAESVDEVILAYPGFRATAVYRLAHWLADQEIPLLPRLLTEHAHAVTGIDIHPRAQIGVPFVIDHGTGVVIGETAEIGRNVVVYQGVTLGALHVSKALARQKRHPTVEDDVVLYAHATILGGKTVVGRGSVIGGNVWLTESVPAGSLVTTTSQVQVSERRPS